jgi:hypothetical protein
MKLVSYIIKNTLISIGFLIAPVIFVIRCAYFHGKYFADKITDDIYDIPDRFIMFQNEIKMSDCCNAPVRAKIKNDDIDYMYCDKCKNKITINK